MPNLPQKLARYLRVSPGSEAFDQAMPLWAEANELAEPRTWSFSMDLPDFYDTFAPHAGLSRDLARTLNGCDAATLMAATIGHALERRLDEHFAKGRPFAGYMLDRMGSFLVEASMRALHAAEREKRISYGGSATRRYSPGYGDFPLDAQAHFIRLIGPAIPGLALTPGHLLRPRKSVTAVCGVHF